MMQIIPVINLKDGQCVHRCGELLDQVSVFSEDPVDVAGRWMDAGASTLYIHDLDGSLRGEPEHADLVLAIAQRFPNLALVVEGGVRSSISVSDYLEQGVRQVVLGSVAVMDPAFVVEACQTYPERIKVVLNALGDEVLFKGGDERSSIPLASWIKQLSACDVTALIVRDLERAGSREGLDLDRAVALAKLAGKPLWLTGGTADMDDVKALYCEAEEGIDALLVSRALDSKALSFKEAQAYLEE